MDDYFENQVKTVSSEKYCSFKKKIDGYYSIKNKKDFLKCSAIIYQAKKSSKNFFTEYILSLNFL